MACAPSVSAAGVCYHTFRERALPPNPENGGLLERARHYFRTKGTKRTAPAAVVVAFPVKGSSDAMSNERTDLMEPLRSLLDTIPQNSSDAIIAADRDGLVRYWNLGATWIFGFGADEAANRSLDLIIRCRAFWGRTFS